MHRAITIFARATAAVGLTAVAGCTITPIQETEGPTSVPSTEPETLAFSTEETPVETTDASPRGDRLLQDVQAAAWTIVASAEQVDLHSAPGNLYTRVGVLDSDNDVIATGRRAEVDGVAWMEIHWANATAWVLQGPFVPLNP